MTDAILLLLTGLMVGAFGLFIRYLLANPKPRADDSQPGDWGG